MSDLPCGTCSRLPEDIGRRCDHVQITTERYGREPSEKPGTGRAPSHTRAWRPSRAGRIRVCGGPRHRPAAPPGPPPPRSRPGPPARPDRPTMARRCATPDAREVPTTEARHSDVPTPGRPAKCGASPDVPAKPRVTRDVPPVPAISTAPAEAVAAVFIAAPVPAGSTPAVPIPAVTVAVKQKNWTFSMLLAGAAPCSPSKKGAACA